MTVSSSFTRSFLMIFTGPIVWALHFVAIYSWTGLLCARPELNREWLGLGLAAWGTLAASFVAIAIIGVASLRARTRPGDGEHKVFVKYLAFALNVLAVLAISWEALPVLLLPACG
jgi:hypothetical protein